MRGWGTLAAGVMLATGCSPNPRNEMPAIAAAALADMASTDPGRHLCVGRTIAPWRPAAEAGRYDPPAPPGYAGLYDTGFRGGGGLKGASVGGVPVSGRPGCIDLRGPLVSGDRAMVEAHLGDASLNDWLKRTDGDWRVVMTTSSTYRH
ncbi:MAG: hypothetical protein ACRYFW_07980 [Janthinobacterium lividum]